MSQELIYNDQRISVNDEMLCLTDMWRAAGSPKNQDPRNWIRFAGKEYIEHNAENLNQCGAPVLKTDRGRGGGTWAYWKIGFAYAKYLSHDFHDWCNEVAHEHMTGMGKRTAIRPQSKKVRRGYTGKLTEHGVLNQIGYARITNDGYKVLLGGTAPELREERQLPPGTNLRERGLTPYELASVMFMEAMTDNRITELKLYGEEQCSLATQLCGSIVKTAVVSEKASHKVLEGPAR